MKFDVVCIGSATYDNYLLSDDFILQKSDRGVMMCQMYGAKVEVKESIVTTGGGATNSAVAFERLGLETGLVACVGKDFWGTMVRHKLGEEGVSLIYLQSTKKFSTSSSIFLVGKDGGRTVLVHRAASNKLSSKKVDWKKLDGKWVYMSSLGGDIDLLDRVVKFARQKNIATAFNPGSGELRQRNQLKSFLPFINVLILNKQELLLLLNKNKDHYIKEDVLALGCEIVLITNGKKGSKLICSDGKSYHQDIVATDVMEETGAGDSFGSSFVAGLVKGFDVELCLQMAAINSSGVVSQIGPKEGLLFWPEMKKKLGI
jgi:sugar/nucleoside kinase (ribokinase family)